MSINCRPPVDVIKVSLPFASRNDANFQSSVLELDSKSTGRSRSRPSSAAKNPKPSNLAKPTLHISSQLTTATSASTKMASPSPKKFSMHTNKSSLSGQASPNSTIDFTRMNTYSRSGTAFQDKPTINITDHFLQTTQTVQTPLVLSKSPKSIGSKTSQKGRSEAPKVPEFQPEPELTEAEISERLYKVFQFYASFGERCNVGYLKSHRFSKMMVDAELRDDLLSQSSLDLLFAAELRKAGNLDFDHFVSLLKRVAKAKFDGQVSDSQEAYDNVLKNYIFPLFEKIFKDDKLFDEESKAISEPLEVSTVMALKLVESTLEQIFKTYFGWELQTHADPQVLRQRLENSLFIFLREFGICPELISKGAAYALYANIMREELPQEPQPTTNESPNATPAITEKNRSSKKKDQDKEKNLPFGFDRFKLFLVRIGTMAYQNATDINGEVLVSKNPQMDRTLQLLERMDVAFRTLNPEKRAALGVTANKSTLLVAQDAIDKITAFLRSQEKVVIVRANTNVVIAPGKRGVLITSGTNYENACIEDEDVIEVMEKHYAVLNRIFQYYCSFGEPMNNSKLHAFKFIKLLREAGLLNASFIPEGSFKILEGLPQAENNLTIADVDIIVASLTGPKQIREVCQKKFSHDPEVASPLIGLLSHLHKSTALVVQNRLDFESYLKAIELVAAKLYPDAKNLGKAVANVLEKNVLKLEKEVNMVQKAIGSEPLKHLVDLLQNTEVVEFLGVVHKSMMQYYKYYSDSMGMMNLEKFMQFCKDFEIFPTIVSKGKLCVFFHALAGVRCQAEETEALRAMDSANGSRNKKKKAVEQTETDLIDQHMFIEALALIANEIKYLAPQPSDIQKISNLLEKMNKSQGPLVVRLNMGITRHNNGQAWDILNDIRIHYPELFRLPGDDLDDEEVDNILQDSIRKN